MVDWDGNGQPPDPIPCPTCAAFHAAVDAASAKAWDEGGAAQAHNELHDCDPPMLNPYRVNPPERGGEGGSR